MSTKAQLKKEADGIEASAKENMTAWILVGQSSKFDEAMDKAAKLRKAAEMPVSMRREFMRNNSL